MFFNRNDIIAGIVLVGGALSTPALAVSAVYAQAGASGNTFGFYSIGVSYYTPVGLSTVNSGPLNGNTASYSPSSAAVGLTAIALSAAVNGTNSGSSEAAADLRAGTVRAKATTSNTFNGVGSASAELYEDLTFSVAGGGSRQVMFVGHLDGTIGSFANSGSLSGLSYNLNFGPSNLLFISQGSQSGFTVSTGGTSGGPPGGWDSYSLTNVTETGFDFNGLFTVTDGDMRALSLRLYLNCQEGVSCDFSHTGSVDLRLPAGVSFTSGSGVFLVPPVIGGVPEPSSWALMLAGFGMVGWAARRRTRAGGRVLLQ